MQRLAFLRIFLPFILVSAVFGAPSNLQVDTKTHVVTATDGSTIMDAKGVTLTVGGFTIYDGAGVKTIVTGSTSGAMFGASGNKIGFLGATPIVRPIGTTDLRIALINLGLYTTGGASPLNLNGGAFTANTISGTSETLSGTFGVTGNSTFGGSVGITGATTASTLSLSGNGSVGGTLSITGTTSGSAFLFSGNGMVGGTLGVTGATTLAALSATTGAFSGASTFTTISGTSETLSGTLGVTGNTTIGGTLVTTGAFSGSSLGLSGNGSIGGNFSVTGATTQTGAFSGSSIALSGNETVGGTLNITGATSGAAFTFTGNGTVGGTFGVTGATTLAAVTATNGTFSGNISAVNAALSGTLGITGGLTGTTAAFSGNETVGGTLGVTGLLHVGPGAGYGTTGGLLLANNQTGSAFDRTLQIAPTQTAPASSNSVLAYIVPTIATGVTQGTLYGLWVDTPQLQGSGAITNYYPAVFTGGNVGIGTSAPSSKLSITDGSTLNPVTVSNAPSMRIDRHEDITSGGGDGSNGPALLVVNNAVGVQQNVGIRAQSIMNTGGSGDVVGIYGTAEFYGSGTKVAFGGFFDAETDTSTGGAIAIETQTTNKGSYDEHYSPVVGINRFIGLDVNYSSTTPGKNGGAGIQVRGGRWDVGLGFMTDSIIKADMQTDSNATSILLANSGSHTSGIDLRSSTFSGNPFSSTGFAVDSAGALTSTGGTFNGPVTISNNGGTFINSGNSFWGARGNSQTLPPSDNGGNALYAQTGNFSSSQSEVDFFNTNNSGGGFRFMQKTGASTKRDVVWFDNDNTAGNTAMILYDANSGTPKRVKVGAADSCGSGKRCLEIDN